MSLKNKCIMATLALCLLAAKGQAQLFAIDESSSFSSLAEGVVMVFDEYGHEVPFPRNAVILFPWEFIEGYWAANIGKVAGVFGFKIDANDPTHKRLLVTYIDRQSSQLLAKGFGMLEDQDRSVRAFIEGPGLSASVVVTAYKLSVAGVTRTEFVTSIQTKDTTGYTNASNYVIQKLR